LTVLSLPPVNPEFTSALKGDLAEALATGLDQVVLQGTPAPGGPQGIGATIPVTPPVGGGGQVLQRMRALASGARAAAPARNPFWILSPAALTTIAEFQTANGIVQAPANGRALDTFPLLDYDGNDGGSLLGYPYVTSLAASVGGQERAYFSADWQEAWIGLDPSFVTVSAHVAAAVGAAAPPPDLVITAAMKLDFALRRLTAFAWAVT